MQGLAVLNAVMIPAGMITACSLLLLGVYDKYSKIVASLRSLHAERRSLIRDSVDHTSLENDYRRRQIDEECLLLRQRLGYALRQMQTIAGATTLFLIASLLLAGGTALHLHADVAAASLVCLGMAALIAAMAQALVEARMIWLVVEAEVSSTSSNHGAHSTPQHNVSGSALGSIH